jgi:hypothetical protein
MKHFNCTGGAFGYINKLVQSEANFEQNPTTKEVFGVKAFEPEGVFSEKLLIILLTFLYMNKCTS